MITGDYLQATKNLVRHGFLSSKGKEALKDLKGKELDKKLKALSPKEVEECANEHLVETVTKQMVRTGYPVPSTEQHYHLIYENFGKPLESFYFWALNHFSDLGFPVIEKITDVFSASETSSFFGSSQQRLGIYQDKVINFLVSIGRLVKELFQIVRELRIIEERLGYYERANSKDQKISNSAEIGLKGLFVELVEQGAKNTNSVYGLARELNFTSLPALFFSIHPKSEEEIEPLVAKLEKDYNKELRTVLIKKLFQYVRWRSETFVELKNRMSHTLKYLRQHYDAIELYLSWVKPYLKHIRRLSTDQRRLDTPDIVSAFEGSLIEVELLARQLPEGNKDTFSVIIMHMLLRTSPQMSFQTDYQRGPIHMGKVEVNWRSYAWTDKDIERYKAMRRDENLDLLGNIDESIHTAMVNLGDDLKRYLKDAGEDFGDEEEEPKKEEKVPTLLDEWKDMYKSWKESLAPIATPFKTIGKLFPAKDDAAEKAKKEAKSATGLAKALCWVHYKNFKKAHRLVTW